jgi:L-lactate dehydrogenase complex protein LldG
MPSPELVGGFTRWATQAGATVEAVVGEAEAAAAVVGLAERIDARRVTATYEAARFAPPGAVVGGSAAEVADADLGISVARLAIAETGSLLLTFPQAGDRLVGMLAHTHAVVVPAAALRASLDDAASALRQMTAPGPEQRRYLTFVTGPSRTADIERVLTIGVQGPRALHLIVVDGA